MDWQEHVVIDSRYLRPTDVAHLQADPSKARKALGWTPKVGFHELVKVMVDADLKAVGIPPVGEGEEFIRQNFDDWHVWDTATAGMATPAPTSNTGRG